MKKINKYIREIVALYTRGDVSTPVKKQVAEWLADSQFGEQKDEALNEFFTSLGNREARRTYDSLLRIHAKIGFLDSGHSYDSAQELFNAMSDGYINPGAKYYKRAKPARLNSKRIGAWRIAASFMLFFILGTGAYFIIDKMNVEKPAPVLATYAPKTTNVGDDEARLDLEDSTSILANCSAVITQTDSRQVSLVGEAFFDVTKNIEEPFVVTTGDLKVTVLGTKFNIDASPANDYTEVTLFSGKVNLTLDNHNFVMNPGDKFRYDHKTRSIEMSKANEDAPDWILSRLTFNQSSLTDIFRVMEWYYNVKIHPADNIDLAEEFSLKVYPSEPLESVLDVLKNISGDLNYRIDGKDVAVSAI